MADCIRVMVVDDSVVARMAIRTMLAKDPSIEVVGVAGNGRVALQQIDELDPDLVILDIEMPEMDGLETLRELRKRAPNLPVIMFSAHTEKGAKCVMEALALGASDYLTKPSNLDSEQNCLADVGEDMRRMIVAVCRGTDLDRTCLESVRGALPTISSALERAGELEPVNLLVVGASTGGPPALYEVLEQLPADFPVPILIVQHMPPVFTRQLAERLNAHCALSVAEAVSGQELLAGHVVIAPGDYHMVVDTFEGMPRLHLNQEPPEQSVRPAVDPLLRSVAAIYGAGVLAVILTGMGKDGLLGCSDVRAAGGRILVQDEETSVVWGMPGYVAEAGLASAVLPLEEIALAVLSRVIRSRNHAAKVSNVQASGEPEEDC